MTIRMQLETCKGLPYNQMNEWDISDSIQIPGGITQSVNYGSIANVVEAKAKAEAGRSDQWSVFNTQTISLSILSANADNQSFNPSVLQSYKFDLFP